MSIEYFDLYNPPSDFINNVYKYYNLLREKSPIHKNSDGSYILTSYKDLVGVYRNFKIWSSDKRTEFGAKFGSSPLFEHHDLVQNSVFNRRPCIWASVFLR